MWWSLLLILGINTVTSEIKRNNYYLNIDNNNKLIGIKTNESINNIDLSGLNIKEISRSVFDDLQNTKSIDLSNNSFAKLPEFIFTNLTKLETLKLSHNYFDKFENNFVGLDNLKTLDISHNPLLHLRRSYFFGLTKNTNIITEGNNFYTLSTDLFENPFLRDTIDTSEVNNDDDINDAIKADERYNSYSEITSDESLEASIDPSLKIKVCKNNNSVLTSVEELFNNESLPDNCVLGKINHNSKEIDLENLKLNKFTKNWYKLGNYSFSQISLASNDITEITPELLNDLPSSIKTINLIYNKIKIINNNTIENNHLKRILLGFNELNEIQDNAFSRTKIIEIFISDNKLDNLGFVKTLPSSIVSLNLGNNLLTNIPDNIFSNLEKLMFLPLYNNQLISINEKSLEGLTSLLDLLLDNNKIEKIDSNAFSSLKNIKSINLHNNKIEVLNDGLFKDLNPIDINLSRNKIKNITKYTLDGLSSSSLRDLYLNSNDIEYIEAESFNKVPRRILDLGNNKIKKILPGTFNLRYLKELHLENNLLTAIDGNSFIGLPKLRHLHLSSNKISNIKKGSMKYLRSIFTISLASNPIGQFNNGDLYGLPKTKGHYLDIHGTSINSIQGGLFDDV